MLIHVPKCSFVFIPVHFLMFVQVCSSFPMNILAQSYLFIFNSFSIKILYPTCQSISKLRTVRRTKAAFVQLFQVCISSASSSYPTSFIAQVVQQHLAPKSSPPHYIGLPLPTEINYLQSSRHEGTKLNIIVNRLAIKKLFIACLKQIFYEAQNYFGIFLVCPNCWLKDKWVKVPDFECSKTRLN